MLSERLIKFLKKEKPYLDMQDPDFYLIYYHAHEAFLNGQLWALEIGQMTDYFDMKGYDPLISIGTFVPAYYLNHIERINLFDIPEGIEIIFDGAFSSTNLSYISIPKSVKKINSLAFANNEQLERIEYKGTRDDWKRISIQERAFSSIMAKHIECTDGNIRLPL